MSRVVSGRWLLLLIPLAISCGGGPEWEELGPHFGQSTAAVTVPSKGTATTLDVACWNIEWFGDTANGPTNETLQQSNVKDAIAGTDFDIWGLEEVVSSTAWANLKAGLPGYAGVLSNEAAVTGGSTSYSSTEQKVALLWKTSLATLVSAKIILTANDFDFAGRPPLEVKLRVTLNGVTEDRIFIVLHMKAFNDTASWQRRQNAGNALKSYLDTTYPTQKVTVLGDWNDDLDTSITVGQASPYQAYVTDSARYAFPSKALTDAHIATTVSYPDAIDHQLDTNELNADYVAGSVESYRVDQYIASYGTTTTDHYPTLVRYNFGGSAPASVTVTSPNGGESWGVGSSQNITWSSSGISNVKLEYTLDNGGTWTVITSSVAASTGSYAWTVPSTASTAARVRATDAQGTLSDTSDGTFAITTSTGTAKVILNELLANEPGSDTAGEFIEIANVGTASIDISGWKLWDSTAARHTFAAGTTLAAGKAIVVFAGATAIPGGLTNAVAASTGALSLANGGDGVSVRNAAGTTVDSFTYSSTLAGTDGVSMNRSPDASATGTFVLHTAISSLSSSPGKRASGLAF